MWILLVYEAGTPRFNGVLDIGFDFFSGWFYFSHPGVEETGSGLEASLRTIQE